MKLRKYFEYQPDLELTVAQIGINKWDWVATNRYDKGYAKRIMSLSRFDILPVHINEDLDHYYQTKNWGDYSEIVLKEILREDIIYYRLSFLDLLRKMQREGKYQFFLADSNEILGLVSLNNLNCLAVYNYIYQITASLEKVVSDFLQRTLDNDEVILMLSGSSDKQAQSIIKVYTEMKAVNKDNTIFQYLFFPTLGTLLKSAADKVEKEVPELMAYRTKFCAGNLYWEIRNIVSHPVKPLFVDENSILKVNELISDYYTIKDVLKYYG